MFFTKKYKNLLEDLEDKFGWFKWDTEFEVGTQTEQIKSLQDEVAQLSSKVAFLTKQLIKAEDELSQLKAYTIEEISLLRAQASKPKAGETWVVSFNDKEHVGFYTWFENSLRFWPNVINEFTKDFDQSKVIPIKQL